MKIVLINAASPDYPWKKSYTPAAFAAANAEFETCPLKEGSVSQGKLTGYRVYHASSLHARETAKMLVGDQTGIPCEETDLLNELPLPPLPDKDREYPLSRYRLQEYFSHKMNDPAGPGSSAESLKNMEEFLDLLEKSVEDAVLVSHERRILLLIKLLRKRKYMIRRGSLLRLAPLERVLAAKDIPTCGGCMHNCQLSNPGCEICRDKAARQKKTGSSTGSGFSRI